MPVLDLRSDTVTKPTDAMRRAMAAAEVGDDVFGEDPTVIALEERAAELLNKEAGLFVSSGTMGNLVSLMAHVPRGGEIIAGVESHTVNDEAANYAVVAGAATRQLQDRPDGTLALDDIRDAFRDLTDPHQPPTSLITIENAHSHSMNRPLAPDYLWDVASIAREHGVPFHIDGARLFNAAVALEIDPKDLAAPADSVTFCLSKGLGCPAGSVVVGSNAFIQRAHRARKLLGGGMRQAGILAAAGLVALADGEQGMIDRLAEDHANARRLAEQLAEMPGIESAGGVAQPKPGRLDPERVVTNFVLFKVDRDRRAFIDALRARNVLMDEYAHGQVRAATHNDVAATDIDTIVAAVRGALEETSGNATKADIGEEQLQGV
ncbi:MAG TPA: GntG family PLP-dependent aldolase [Candidatus Limnocylindrales bacterium]|nr:GntG family PLP-dependent aldolase [Candidatus Limnocylindrales bacterium]